MFLPGRGIREIFLPFVPQARFSLLLLLSSYSKHFLDENHFYKISRRADICDFGNWIFRSCVEKQISGFLALGQLVGLPGLLIMCVTHKEGSAAPQHKAELLAFFALKTLSYST